jgi:NAD(P)-dependent dehydrogenase (short-subunit alcohol dehydrogenase family)
LAPYEPQVVVLVAGASPLMRPLQHQTWETFSVNWHTDVKIAFHWLREILLKPLRPGSRVVVISSGAAVAVLKLVRADASTIEPGYLLTSAGLRKLP